MSELNLRTFVAIAENGTLSAAARELATSVSTVSRRLDALEADVGLQLVVRTVDGTYLTDDGEQLLPRALSSVEAGDAFWRAAAAAREGVGREPVRLSATEPMISDVLAPALPALNAASPSTVLQLSSSNEPASLARRDADMALRLVRPTGDSLIARRLPDIQLGCFCSRSFLGKRKVSTIDIAEEPMLVFDDSFGEIAEVRWLRENDLEAQTVLKSLSSRALMNAAVAGAGVAIVPRFMARSAKLVEVPAPAIPSRQVWLVLHRDLRHNREMQVVRNWVVSTVRDALG